MHDIQQPNSLQAKCTIIVPGSLIFPKQPTFSPTKMAERKRQDPSYDAYITNPRHSNNISDPDGYSEGCFFF